MLWLFVVVDVVDDDDDDDRQQSLRHACWFSATGNCREKVELGAKVFGSRDVSLIWRVVHPLKRVLVSIVRPFLSAP